MEADEEGTYSFQCSFQPALHQKDYQLEAESPRVCPMALASYYIMLSRGTLDSFSAKLTGSEAGCRELLPASNALSSLLRRRSH